MKLIVEKINGVVYAYRERDKLHRKLQTTRDTPQLDQSKLDDECDLSEYDNFHMVFDIKRK